MRSVFLKFARVSASPGDADVAGLGATVREAQLERKQNGDFQAARTAGEMTRGGRLPSTLETLGRGLCGWSLWARRRGQWEERARSR